LRLYFERDYVVRVRRSERRLPHWDTVDQPLFVTFRLYGSLPQNRVFPHTTLTSGEAFVAMDKLLDAAVTGPRFLQRPEVAEIIVTALKSGQHEFHRYELHAFVVMANHVHLLITPRVIATKWLGALKGFTAHEANRLLGTQGRTFWQDESYDHLVHSGEEFRRIERYILNNPVKAGMAASPADFPWSGATAA
jgi:REP element-mobilizing transposase RayT